MGLEIFGLRDKCVLWPLESFAKYIFCENIQDFQQRVFIPTSPHDLPKVWHFEDINDNVYVLWTLHTDRQTAVKAFKAFTQAERITNMSWSGLSDVTFYPLNCVYLFIIAA